MLIPDTLVFSKEVPDNSSTTAEIDIMANIRIHIKRIEKQNTKVEGGGGFQCSHPCFKFKDIGGIVVHLS